MKRRPLLLALGVGAVLLAGGLLFNWMNRESPAPVVTPSNQPDERVELRPPNSGEAIRRHVIGRNGREIRTEIVYMNGDSAVTKLYPDGNMQEFKRTDKDGKILILRKFARDGKTVIGGEEHREDGTMKVFIEQTTDGLIKTTVYWYDGKKVFSVTRQRANGSYETTFYRKNGTMSGKRVGPKADVVARDEVFDKDGKLTMAKERSAPDKLLITYYGANGRATHRQTFVEEKTSWGTNKRLTEVEEFEWDGRTVKRKIVYENSRYSPTETHTFTWDGGVTVKKLRYDGTVESEETRDRYGNVTDRKDYSSSDNVREDIDSSRSNEPWQRDPVENWDLQERYPYYRNQDD